MTPSGIDIRLVAEREIELRYPGRCVDCTAPLSPGVRAWWDGERKTATCIPCHSGGSVMEAAAGARTTTAEAGASAQREYDRRAAKREARVRERHPKIGGFLLAISEEPNGTSSWAKGARGERLVGDRLDAVADRGVIALHDRRKPRSKGNIDHIAVTPTGIYVIDAKRYKGRLERRDVGGWFRSDGRLYVAGRDRTRLTDGVIGHVAAVRESLGGEFSEVPIWSVLCFVHCDVGLLTRPFVVNGVSVTWPRPLQKSLVEPGTIDDPTRTRVAETLDRTLPPA